MKAFLSRFSLFALIVLSPSHFLLSCATPAENFNSRAAALGLVAQETAGSPFRHRLFINDQALHMPRIAELHVYLDGDGTPWINDSRAAEDPTARNPLILELMKTDSAPALLLGRPCYYGIKPLPECNSKLWTSQRYSEAVLNSMTAALKHWLTEHKVDHLVLIGFSGGGSLAALMAPAFDNITSLVTIAANLDIEAWSTHHQSLKPSASLNPIDAPPLPATIRQYHLAGLEDDNVPANIIRSYSDKQQNALYLSYPKFDHACCWQLIWPQFVQDYLQP